MRKSFIWWLNVGLLSGIGFFSLGGMIEQGRRVSQFQQPPLRERAKHPSKNDFMNKESYTDFGESILRLHYSPLELRLPDLREKLIYYGRNQRPDAQSSELFFSLGSPEEIVTVSLGIPIYLELGAENKLRFSEGNRPTDLWFEAKAQDSQAQVNLSIRDEKGQIHRYPEERAQFLLKEMPLRYMGALPSLGPWRFDASILARQGAKWSGRDLFLETHGGEEFRPLEGKQRITFGTGSEKYAVYLEKGDFLVWKGGKWGRMEKGESAKGLPLLKLEKIDEHLLSFTLFDSSGKMKIPLAIGKSIDPLSPLPETDFQFIGARTRVHSMFNLRGQREIVGPNDWFVLQDNRWNKLKNVKDLNDFVEGKREGLLLIINRLVGEGGDRRFEATLYNTSRSNSIPITLPLQIKEEGEKSKPDEKGEKLSPPIYVPKG